MPSQPAASDAELASRLRGGAAELGLGFEEATVEQLVRYLRLLDKWNRTYNLTAVRDPRDMVVRHLLDCLAVLPHLTGGSAADVGSGAGLPGIPLAVAAPDRRLVLIEASDKKALFLEAVRDELGLANVEIERARAERYRPARPFEAVLSRAVASLGELPRLAGHLCAAGGRLLAMKAAIDPVELEGLPYGWSVRAVHRLAVPGLRAERHLVVLVPVESRDAAEKPRHRSR